MIRNTVTFNPKSAPHQGPVPLGFQSHAHDVCISTTLKAVEALCKSAGLRLTPVRRKVLEVLLEDHRALGAYAILKKLEEAGFGSQPPVAYRALEFLTEHGFAHKIERLSAFMACAHPGEDHAPAFMICRKCDAVAETHIAPMEKGLEGAAKAAGFQIEKAVIEAVGVCPSCASASTP